MKNEFNSGAIDSVQIDRLGICEQRRTALPGVYDLGKDGFEFML
jgi:hypothetical protein